MSGFQRLALVGLAVALGIGTATAGLPFFLVTLAIWCLVGAVTLSLPVLFAAALAANLLIPVKYLPFPSEPATINPGLFLIGLFALRIFSRARSDHGTLPAGVTRALFALAGWIAVGALRSPSPPRSAGWALSFVALAIAPPLLAPLAAAFVRPAIRFLMVCAAILGGYAVVEAFVWHGNPVYGHIYSSAHYPLSQAWSVYRATTLLGHPLMNATVFALAVPFMLTAWKASRSKVWLLGIALTAAGGYATQSRAGLLAMAIGTGVTVLTWSERATVLKKLAVVGGLVSVIAFGSSYVDLRSASSEGQRSSMVRSESLQVGKQLLGRSLVLGAGPGLADHTKKANGLGTFRGSGIENSWLQLGVSLGLPGLALFGFVYCFALKVAYQRRNAAALGALAAYGLMALAFNLVEANQPALILLGFVFVASFQEGPPKIEPDPPVVAELAGRAH